MFEERIENNPEQLLFLGHNFPEIAFALRKSLLCEMQRTGCSACPAQITQLEGHLSSVNR